MTPDQQSLFKKLNAGDHPAAQHAELELSTYMV